MLKKFLFGLPRTEVLKYSSIMRNTDPKVISEDDWAQFEKHSLRSMLIKGIALPTAFWVGYSIPISLLYVKTEFLRVSVGVIIYRLATFQQNYKAFECMKEICVRYHLEEINNGTVTEVNEENK